MKTLDGKVVSVKMQNTAVVAIERKRPHPLYRKLMKMSKKFKADTNGKNVSLGDLVRIANTRPLAKQKHFKIIEVLKGKEKNA